MSLWGYSQTLSVSSFRLLESDLTANTSGTTEKDQNGETAALIKVVTTQMGFSFDCGSLGIVKTVQKPSEVWVYVPHGIKKMTVSHPQLGLLRDYNIPVPIEAARTYELVLTSGTVQTIVRQDAGGQYFVLTIEPENAVVYIDDNEVEVNNAVVSKLLSYGKHTYRITAPLYHSEAGFAEIGKSKLEQTISLKPDYGIVSLSTTPEEGANVYLDDEAEPIGVTPVTTKKLSKGLHRFKIQKSGYVSKDVSFDVKGDGSTQFLPIAMEQNFGILKVKLPEVCDFYINNEKIDIGAWNGRLSEGLYYLEARRPSHRPSTMNLTVTKGKTQSITMPDPTPIVGMLDISSTPINATVQLDGNKLGSTPNIFNNVLVGSHVLTIKHDGYNEITEFVEIKEGEVCKKTYQLETITKPSMQPVSSGISDHSYSLNSYRTRDGGDYYGDMKDGKPNGRGKTSYRNGDTYEGEYYKGLRTGYGTYTFSDGERYEGQWLSDQQHGHGTFYFKNGSQYVGEWFRDYQQGHGVMYYFNGDKYDGNWYQDHRNGKGIYTSKSGASYDGEWRYDEKWGKGRYTFADGVYVDGTWSQNRLVSVESVKSSKGKTIEGTWADVLIELLKKGVYDNTM